MESRPISQSVATGNSEVFDAVAAALGPDLEGELRRVAASAGLSEDDPAWRTLVPILIGAKALERVSDAIVARTDAAAARALQALATQLPQVAIAPEAALADIRKSIEESAFANARALSDLGNRLARLERRPPPLSPDRLRASGSRRRSYAPAVVVALLALAGTWFVSATVSRRNATHDAAMMSVHAPSTWKSVVAGETGSARRR